MLTRLELVGFKSFAEKTRFDFAPGITAVVGPNGSGKSNIIDAVKWVLGEQSARNLRGGEMLDVIFNGSSTRKSLGLAEVSLTFDNRLRQLTTDADEVQIARRVYRDGQGEYLINGQIARLKDVKDLFLGSGAGHGAYSVIEQGRVDALLTASPKDRRALFEEAAGISRFKVKKLETLRKLDRVDLDLTRVRDLLQELEKQLRTLRLQASKAQKFKEYSQSLRDLRITGARREWSDLQQSIQSIEGMLDAMRVDVNEFGQSTTTTESRLRHLKVDLDKLERDLRERESQLAEARQLIAGYDATIKHERIQSTGLEIELLRMGKQRFEAISALQRLNEELAESATLTKQLDERVSAANGLAEAMATTFREIESRIAGLNTRTAKDRESQFRLVNETARMRGEIERSTSDRDRANRELERKRSEHERLEIQRETVDAILDDLTGTDTDLQSKLTGAKQNHAEHLTYREELLRKIAGMQGELETQRERRSSLRGRIDVLEDLERRLEGLGAGVREVVRRRGDNDTSLDSIAGLVVDLLNVPRNIVHLVEIALGERTQYFVVTDEPSWETIVEATRELPGRVGLIPLYPSTPPAIPQLGYESLCTWVTCDEPTSRHLPGVLLGDVYLVSDLHSAYESQAQLPHARFITTAGELLEPDGTLVVGPPDSAAGVLSRKSELRGLREQQTQLDERIRTQELTQTNLRRQCDSLDAPIRALDAEISALSGESGTLRDQIRHHEQLRSTVTQSLQTLEIECKQLQSEFDQTHTRAEQLQATLTQSEHDLQIVIQRLAEADAALLAVREERESAQQQHLAAQVEVGRLREQWISLQNRHSDLNGQLQRRQRDEESLSSMEHTATVRLRDSQLAILRSTSASAETCAAKERAERFVAEIAEQRKRLRADHDHLQELASRTRDQWTEQKDRTHALELQWNELTVRRDAIQTRIREEYQLELHDLPPLDSSVEINVEAANAECEDLRQKIARLGNVNLEALVELEEIEKRESDLRTQHDDLADSHRKLGEIIARINTDSEILFNKTMNDIRVHFQELFRKLFGGGMADIIMEDTANPLESGIEITARPPGKELRSISLLSGGERTLTAIALLLAVFRSRPSPFCLLDEVDAALDEANTERLAAMLREFVQQSQFIVITHKKRTMAVADVLYGITMQESGVSKQVSVRFEDWEDESEMPQKSAA